MGNKLKQKRREAMLTQVEAAEQIGVARSTIAMWETGKCLPRTHILKKIAEVYGCKMADLLDEEG